MSRVVSGRSASGDYSLAVFIVLFSSIVVGLAVSAYMLMLPTRLENPGFAAYANVARLPGQPDTVAEVTASVAKVPAAPVPQREVEANKATPEVKADNKKPQHSGRKSRPRIDPRTAWAFQPFFGLFRR
jgi:hypothetical protein